MSVRNDKLRKERGSEESNHTNLASSCSPHNSKWKLVNSKTALICVSSCCCVIFLYLTVVGSYMGIFYFKNADEDLVSCDESHEAYKMQNTCQSDSQELDLTANSSIRTQITHCTTGKIRMTRCQMPKTFFFYDLLSMERMTSRVGYSSQCALEGTQPVKQSDVWMQMPLEPSSVYWSDGKWMTASINGSLLAYVPICKSNFVRQPIGVNFTMDSLNEVILQGYIDIPFVKAVIEGTVFIDFDAEGWYDYSGSKDIESSADFSLKLLASVIAKDILLEYPSRNGLIAVKSESVSATLNISELGEINDFSFSFKDSTFCNEWPYNIYLCPYIEDFIFNTYADELLDLVLLYATAGFADLADILAVKVKNSTYTELDFWGLESACSLAQCDGETLEEFVEHLHVAAWLHIGLFSMLFPLSCCSIVLFKRSNQYIPLLDHEDSGRYGSIT